eukprot:Sdes_comp18110_c0_seq2m7555
MQRSKDPPDKNDTSTSVVETLKRVLETGSRKRPRMETSQDNENISKFDVLATPEWELSQESLASSCPEISSDVATALVYLFSCVDWKHFQNKIPPVALKHQLYCILPNRTSTDKEVLNLNESQ